MKFSFLIFIYVQIMLYFKYNDGVSVPMPLPITAICNFKKDGDMLGLRDESKNSRLWPNGVLYYEISAELYPAEKLIYSAMKHIESKTCIRFKKRNNEKNYIEIFSGQGCYSYVGRQNKGKQPLSLGNGCLYFGTIVHELIHAIGFHHEQNRYDRDKHVKILWSNIIQKFRNQFQRVSVKKFPQLLSFDYNSIMLYGSYSFSVDRKKPTMLAKRKFLGSYFLKEVFQKKSMSVIDAKRIRILYKCNRHNSFLYFLNEVF